MQKNRQNDVKRQFLSWGLPIFILFSLIVRLFFSVEITDEAQYIAWTQNLLNEGRFFSSDLFYQQVASILVVPFFYLYKILTNSNDYLILINRFIFLISLCLASFCYFQASKRVFDKTVAILSATMLLVYVPFSIYAVSYNTLAVFFLNLYFLGGLSTVLTNTSNMGIFTGLFGALAAFFYPTLSIVILPSSTVFIFLFSNRNRILFTIGASLTILFALVFFSSIGWDTLTESLRFTSSFGALHPWTKVGEFGYDLFIFKKPIWILNIIFLCAYLALNSRSPNRRQLISFVVAVLTFFPLVIGIHIFGKTGYAPAHLFLNTVLALIWPWITYISIKNRNNKIVVLLFIQFLFFMATALLCSWTSSNGTLNAALGGLGALISCFLIMSQLSDIYKPNVPTIFSVLAILTLGFGNYKFVYRDSEIIKLNIRVEHGPYAGLWTHQERLQTVNDLNKVMNSIPQSSRIIVFYNTPAPYMWNGIVGNTPFYYYFCTDFSAEKIVKHVINPTISKLDKTEYLIVYYPDGANLSELCSPVVLQEYMVGNRFIENIRTTYWTLYKKDNEKID